MICWCYILFIIVADFIWKQVFWICFHHLLSQFVKFFFSFLLWFFILVHRYYRWEVHYIIWFCFIHFNFHFWSELLNFQLLVLEKLLRWFILILVEITLQVRYVWWVADCYPWGSREVAVVFSVLKQFLKILEVFIYYCVIAFDFIHFHIYFLISQVYLTRLNNVILCT